MEQEPVIGAGVTPILLRDFARHWAELAVQDVDAARASLGAVTVDDLSGDLEAMAARLLLATIPGEQQFIGPNSLIDAFLPLAVRVESTEPRRFVTIAAAIVNARLRRGESAKAVAALTSALAIVETYSVDDLVTAAEVLPWLWLAAGMALSAEADVRSAVPFYSRIIARGVGGWVGYMASGNLSLALSLAGQLGTALPLAENAIEIGRRRGWLASDYVSPALVALPVIYGSYLRIPEFRVALDELVAANATDPLFAQTSVTLRAEYARMTGETAAGLALLDAAIGGLNDARTISHTRTFLRRAHATLLVCNGQPGFALKECEGIADQPEHLVCYNSIRGLAYLSLGQSHEALATTDACMDLGDAHSLRSLPDVLAIRAAANIALGRTETAVAMFADACSLGPNSGYVGMSLLPKTQLSALLEAAHDAGLDVPDEVDVALALTSNDLDTTLATIGSLTRGERTLLLALNGPETLDEIATRTFTARNTVKAHVHNLSTKLGVASRREAVIAATRFGFYELADEAG